MGKHAHAAATLVLSRSLRRMLDPSTLCDGVDRSHGYVLCRMVQILIVNTMRQTKPA